MCGVPLTIPNHRGSGNTRGKGGHEGAVAGQAGARHPHDRHRVFGGPGPGTRDLPVERFDGRNRRQVPLTSRPAGTSHRAESRPQPDRLVAV
jgi:hypothetical protein